jgi:hypothetical protein
VGSLRKLNLSQGQPVVLDHGFVKLSPANLEVNIKYMTTGKRSALKEVFHSTAISLLSLSKWQHSTHVSISDRDDDDDDDDDDKDSNKATTDSW